VQQLGREALRLFVVGGLLVFGLLLGGLHCFDARMHFVHAMALSPFGNV
jgi:hypothetical protein